MDRLRDRFVALPGGRLKVLLVALLLVVAALVAAVVVGAGQGAGTSTEVGGIRPVATAQPTATPALVHVSGAVRRPGLVALPAGSRVVDAVAAAGGLTAAADESAINLAARIVDGQQLVVPKRGAAPTTATGGAAASGSPVSLGAATAEQLETLPRIGPALAARIIAYRDAHGGFGSVDDLGKVSGIGPKTLAGLRDLVTP